MVITRSSNRDTAAPAQPRVGMLTHRYALIGAGSVVTKSVPPYALIVGNPGKQIGWVSEYGHRLNFNEKGLAFCEESMEKYMLSDGQVNKVL